MKKFIFAVFISLFVFGCTITTQNPSYYNDGNSTNTTMQTKFNEETYVWENFIFSTNRVEQIK